MLQPLHFYNNRNNLITKNKLSNKVFINRNLRLTNFKSDLQK